MKFIQKQMSLWRIVLILGVAAIAIPIASRVGLTAKAVVKERPDYLDLQTTAHPEDADAKHSVRLSVALPQDDYYERRREYWDKRVERRLDRREEYLDEQVGNDKDDAEAKDKNSKDAADDEDDADDIADKDVKAQQDSIEKRREYWRQRLEKEW